MTALAAMVIGFDDDSSQLPFETKMIQKRPSILKMRVDALQRDDAADGCPRALPAVVGDQRDILVKRQRPGETARLRDVGSLCGLQTLRRCQSHADGDIVEQIVVGQTGSGANGELSAAAERPYEAEHRSHVVPVRVHAGRGQGDRAVSED